MLAMACPVMALAQLPGPGAVAPPQRTAPAPGAAPRKAPSPAELTRIQAELDALFERLEASTRALPRDTFEPATVIEQVGRDPAKLAAWVGENTAWVPYQGALRGTTGVLNDRVGSHLDRALLLAELLRQAGHEARLARATLDEGAGAKVLAAAVPRADVLSGSYEGGDPQVIARVTAHAPRLRAALGDGARAVDPTAHAERLAAARDHWWVQRREGDNWVDVPLSDAAGVAAEETLPPALPDGALRLSDSYVHVVDVRLVIEAFDGKEGKLVERPVLETTVRPAELAGRGIVLRHFPMKMSAKPPTSADAAAIRAGVLSQTEWIPVLEVAGRRVARRSFNDAGEVNDNPNLSGAAQIGGATGGLFGGLGGGLGGGGGDEPQPAASVLTAEWIEYVIRAPGAKARTVRRPLFDTIGPAARSTGMAAAPALDEERRFDRGLALAGVTESLVIGFSPSRRYVMHASADELLAERKVWAQLLAEKDGAKRDALAASIRRSAPLLHLAAARRSFSPVRDRTWVGGVNVLNYQSRVAPDGRGLVTRHVMDLASNPVSSTDDGAGFDARVAQGVADTAAEDAALAGAEPSPFNTLGLLERPGAGGLVAVRDVAGADAALAGLGAAPDVRARVAADLSAGYVAVLPAKRPAADGPLGWWRVHPVTGETVGVMDSGYHQDITEEAHLEDGTVIRAAEGLDKTFIRARPQQYWKQNYSKILRDMGADPADQELAGMIIDLQRKMLEAGIWL